MRNIFLLGSFLLAGCHSPEPHAESSDVSPPQVRESELAAPDASFDSPDSASGPPPAACADGGPAAWYLTTKSTDVPDETILQWRTNSGLSQALVARDGGTTPLAELLDRDYAAFEGVTTGLKWLDHVAVGVPAAHLTALTELPNTDDTHRYRVSLTGHESGGMTCHANRFDDLQGEVVVDAYGFVMRADLRGTSTTIPATTNPACGAKVTRPISLTVRRSCTVSW